MFQWPADERTRYSDVLAAQICHNPREELSFRTRRSILISRGLCHHPKRTAEKKRRDCTCNVTPRHEKLEITELTCLTQTIKPLHDLSHKTVAG